MQNRARRRSTNTSPQVAGVAGARVVLEAQVVAMAEPGVRVRTIDGRLVDCRCAHGIDRAWLAAAVDRGPVDAEISLGSDGTGSLWAIFPGAAHADVLPARVGLSATDEVSLRVGPCSVVLSKDGKVRVRGRDVAARGSRLTRIQGGTVRIN